MATFDNLPATAEVRERLNKLATQTKRFIGLEVALERVDGSDVVVSTLAKKEGLTDPEIVDRTLDLFRGDYPLELVHVYVKREGQKFALTHDTRYLLSFKDEPFVARVSPDVTPNIPGTWIFFTGADRIRYALYPLDQTPEKWPSVQKVVQSEKWFKRELIQQKEASEKSAEATVLTIEVLRQYFKDYPAINQSAFATEAGISDRHLRMILSGDRQITHSVALKLLPVMARYGSTVALELAQKMLGHSNKETTQQYLTAKE